MKMAQLEVKKLNGGGSLQGKAGGGGGGTGMHSMMSWIVWCLVPCGEGEVRGQLFQRGPGFPAASQSKVVINKCFS